jgi:AmiR/NasT family two-component response regulator
MDLDRPGSGTVAGTNGQDLAAAGELVTSAVRILMARRGCTRADAHWLLSRAAPTNNLSVIDLAACVVAEQALRSSPGGP